MVYYAVIDRTTTGRNMKQTTMKLDCDVLDDLRNLAAQAYRSPQKHLRFLVEQEKQKHAQKYSHSVTELTPEQQARAEIVRQTEASSALEGYRPESEIGGYVYELQQKWIMGKITIEEYGNLLKKHYGLK